MEVSIGEQTIAITAAAVCGLAAGLLYDLLRQIRYGGGKAAGVICDVVFCLFCTGSLFLVGLAFGGGCSGIWEGIGFLSAFGLYLFGISPSITPLFGNIRKKGKDFTEKVQKK